jgi:hypothetical protein
MRGFTDKLRALAFVGATVVATHHDGKADTARDFRGSSDFKASFDQCFHVSNISSDSRLDRLSLRCFKSRYGFSGLLVYHYAGGRFIRDERTEAPARTAADQLTDLLRLNPGLTGDKFEKLAASKGISSEGRLCGRFDPRGNLGEQPQTVLSGGGIKAQKVLAEAPPRSPLAGEHFSTGERTLGTCHRLMILIRSPLAGIDRRTPASSAVRQFATPVRVCERRAPANTRLARIRPRSVRRPRSRDGYSHL